MRIHFFYKSKKKFGETSFASSTIIARSPQPAHAFEIFSTNQPSSVHVGHEREQIRVLAKIVLSFLALRRFPKSDSVHTLTRARQCRRRESGLMITYRRVGQSKGQDFIAMCCSALFEWGIWVTISHTALPAPSVHDASAINIFYLISRAYAKFPVTSPERCERSSENSIRNRRKVVKYFIRILAAE